MDVREVDPALASAARQALLAAFRYQRGSGAVPMLALGVTRFADAPVLAAVAERAIATTLVTSEGRALTEVSLWVRNRAQPFIKVALPTGASMLTVEVAGAPAKPVEGKDGTRVPLLRPGFRFGWAVRGVVRVSPCRITVRQKGNMQMTLPENGPADQRRRVGAVRAGPVPRRSASLATHSRRISSGQSTRSRTFAKVEV